MTNTNIPSADELPVTATYDLTGVSASEYRTDGARTAQVRVVAFHTATSGRRYARILWRDEEFMASLSDLSFE